MSKNNGGNIGDIARQMSEVVSSTGDFEERTGGYWPFAGVGGRKRGVLPACVGVGVVPSPGPRRPAVQPSRRTVVLISQYGNAQPGCAVVHLL